LIEKCPLIDKCGSFKCGSDQEKLNLLLMALIALETAFFALLMALEMLDFMLLNTLETVVLAALKPVLIPFFTASTAVLTVVFTFVQTEETVFWILFITEDTVDFAVFQALTILVLMPSTIGVRTVLIAVHAVVRAVCNAVTTAVTFVLMVSQAVVIPVLMVSASFIFKEAGSHKLQAACNAIGGCDEGSAVITPGFNLKAKYIIHAVGPRWNGGNCGEEKKLYTFADTRHRK